MKIAGFKITNGCAVLSESVTPTSMPIEVFKAKIIEHVLPLSSHESFSKYIKDSMEGITSSLDLPKVIQYTRTEYRMILEEMAASLKNEINHPGTPDKNFDQKLFTLYSEDMHKFFGDNDIIFKLPLDISTIYSWDFGDNLKLMLNPETLITAAPIMLNDPGVMLARIDYRNMLARPEYNEATVYNYIEYSLRNALSHRKVSVVSGYNSLWEMRDITRAIKAALISGMRHIGHSPEDEETSKQKELDCKTVDDFLNIGEASLFSKFLELSKNPVFDVDFATADEDLKDIIAISFSNIIYAMISIYAMMMLVLLSEIAKAKYCRSNHEIYLQNRSEMLKALGIKE